MTYCSAVFNPSTLNEPMSQQAFYQTERVLAPDRQSTGGPVTQRYIIAVDTHDPDGKPYLNPKKRAREAFNLLPGRTVDDWVALAEINEEDVPKEKLQKIVLRHDGAVYLVKHD